MTSTKQTSASGNIVIEEQTRITLTELCNSCGVESEWIIDLVKEGVLTPSGESPERWSFSSQHLRRASIATRLQRDLDVNLPGAALALELLEEIETLRSQLDALDSESG